MTLGGEVEGGGRHSATGSSSAAVNVAPPSACFTNVGVTAVDGNTHDEHFLYRNL